MTTQEKATVIVGGGFVGLFTALHLSHRRYEHPVVLIDAQPRFVFKPLLYEYLTGEMQEEQVVPTYETLLKGSQVVFVKGEVDRIDLDSNQVFLKNKLQYDYQYLVLAVGSVQGFFGTEGAQQYAFPFRTHADALELKQHLHDCLQKATQESDRAIKQQLLTVAVVGAGPSGVEMAATLADLLPSWYARLGGNSQEIQIVLVNHGEEILQGDVNTELKEIAERALKHKQNPVEMLLGVGVKSVGKTGLTYQKKGENSTSQLATATTIWTVGTATNPLLASLPLPEGDRDKHNQPYVTPTLQLLNFPNVFAAGDCAIVQSDPAPPVAQIAYQQGAGIAHNLIALSQHKPPQPVRAHMRGTLMKLGMHNGVANLFNKVEISGEAGDLVRNGTYLELLPTPVHNFKATAEWLTDELFERHQQGGVSSAQRSSQKNRSVIWIGSMAIALTILACLTLAIQSRRPSPEAPRLTQP